MLNHFVSGRRRSCFVLKHLDLLLPTLLPEAPMETHVMAPPTPLPPDEKFSLYTLYTMICIVDGI